MTTQIDVPANVRRMVDDVVIAAQSAFGESLRAIVLYGSAAEGRMRASSDVNLLFVLTSFEAQRANAFREAYRFAQSAVNVTAMFVLEQELQDAEKAFAQKFADIRRRHVVLYGVSPFKDVAIPREALVRRLQQMLLNLAMRARQSYVERSLREEQCAVTVAEITGPLRTAASSILELERREILSPKEALEVVARELNRPEFLELLPHLSEAREQRVLPAGRAAAILFQVVELVQAIYQRSLKL